MFLQQKNILQEYIQEKFSKTKNKRHLRLC